MVSSNPVAASTRTSKPVLTITGLLLPVAGVGAAVFFARRTPGLAAIAVFVVAILAGAVLGAVSTLLGALRREPRRDLQVVGLMANAGILVFFAVLVLHRRPAQPAPLGEPAFLALAPGPTRVGPQSIYLAYPVTNTPAAQRGYVIGKRDARGVVVSLRTADFSVPLKPGELRLQLVPANGLWSVGRNAEHIQGIPYGEWQQAAYLALRVNPGGWAVPNGIADKELRPIGPPRL